MSRPRELSKSDRSVSLLINGQCISTEQNYPVANPSNGEQIWTYSSANITNATLAVESAKTASEAWSATNPRARAEIIYRAADLFSQRREQLEQYMKLETAADDAFIGFNIEATIKQLKDLAGRVTAVQGYFPSVEDDGRSALILKEPYGVILGIAPWYATLLACDNTQETDWKF